MSLARANTSVFGYIGSEAHSARFEARKKRVEAEIDSPAIRPGRAGPRAARPRSTMAANAA